MRPGLLFLTDVLMSFDVLLVIVMSHVMCCCFLMVNGPGYLFLFVVNILFSIDIVLSFLFIFLIFIFILIVLLSLISDIV